jgi:xylose isomerase
LIYEPKQQNWEEKLGKVIHSKNTGLDTLHQIVVENDLKPQAKSGQQEMLENILNKYL